MRPAAGAAENSVRVGCIECRTSRAIKPSPRRGRAAAGGGQLWGVPAGCRRPALPDPVALAASGAPWSRRKRCAHLPARRGRCSSKPRFKGSVADPKDDDLSLHGRRRSFASLLPMKPSPPHGAVRAPLAPSWRADISHSPQHIYSRSCASTCDFPFRPHSHEAACTAARRATALRRRCRRSGSLQLPVPPACAPARAQPAAIRTAHAAAWESRWSCTTQQQPSQLGSQGDRKAMPSSQPWVSPASPACTCTCLDVPRHQIQPPQLQGQPLGSQQQLVAPGHCVLRRLLRATGGTVSTGWAAKLPAPDLVHTA